MGHFSLSETEREGLRALVGRTTDVTVLRRAQALLSLDAGDAPSEVAARWGTVRSTMYDWRRRFRAREGEALEDRLRDRPRSGRPPACQEAVKAALSSLMETDPRGHGYRYPTWTVPLLRHHLQEVCGIDASETTIRRALHGLGYRWKRPRFVLSRRSPTWRQAKGGSNAACEAGSGR